MSVICSVQFLNIYQLLIWEFSVNFVSGSIDQTDEKSTMFLLGNGLVQLGIITGTNVLHWPWGNIRIALVR